MHNPPATENSGKLSNIRSIFQLTGILKRRFKLTQGAHRFEILSCRYTNNAEQRWL